MKRALILLALLPSLALAQLPAPGEPGAPDDPRYCGEPTRDARGDIKRNKALLRAFAKVHPCPSTLEPTPSCEDWAIDHVIPLDAGGCDSLINLQWLPSWLKSCRFWCKDRWERKYHGHPRRAVVIPEELLP